MEKVEDQADYLPRIWAKLAIDDMLKRDAEANRVRIIELSKSMYVMSPFTSLLVLENDEMYEQYNVDRGRQDHWALYPCPEQIEVVHEPLYGPLATTSSDADNQQVKPSIEEVLRTLLIRSFDPGHGTPVRVEWTTTPTVVSVPDGGTVLLGGIKRRANEGGIRIPVLTNLPYVNRLFRNQAIGQDAHRLMMTVTPRIIIQEEEETLLLPILIDDSVTLNFTEIDLNGNGVFDTDGLIDLINGTLSATSWQEIGVTGAIDPFQANISLIISQAQQVHGQTIPSFAIQNPYASPTDAWLDLDALIGQAGAKGYLVFADSDDFLDWTQLTGRRERYRSVDLAGTMEGRILAQLDSSGEFKYAKQPLQEVIADLQQRFDLPIVLDREALEARGIATDTPVTLDVGETSIKLKSALMLMLEDLGLVFFVSDDVLQVTTPENMEDQLAASNDDTDELLLLMRRDRLGAPETDPSAFDDLDRLAHWARILEQRVRQDSAQPNWLYPQPETLNQRRSTRRLVDFAPAIATSSADALAIIEEEANLERRPEPGNIDERARELIEAARRWDWLRMTLRDGEDQVAFEVTIDGQGRFRFDHQTDQGLREIVICDGPTLRHLYPELGLGTTRSMSRFHRTELAQLVPWLLPTVDDLALGADLRLIGPSTIAIAPHDVAPHDVGHDSAEDQAKSYLRQHLEFAEDGRLAQRSLVEMPSGKTLVRVSFSEEGTVRWYDGDDQQRDEFHISLAPAEMPDLTPTSDALVVLPMPVRTREHVYQQAMKASGEAASDAETADALRTIASDDQHRAGDPGHWSEAAALQLLAADLLQNPAELRDVIGRRFFARGDRRIGFYTLLLSSGQPWDVDARAQLSDGTTTKMDPLADHPASTLAHYIDSRLRRTRFDIEQAGSQTTQPMDRFILDLAEYQQLAARWSLPLQPPEDAEIRRRELDELFGFLSRCESPRFAYTLLRRLQRRYGDSQPHARIAAALIEQEKGGTISYGVKYELARSLANRGETTQARALFVQLYREALDAGVLPPIDPTFASVIQGAENPFPSDDDGENGFHNLMRGAAPN